MSEVERLLVVDDEAPILHALQRTFEAAGYEVCACSDPAEALDRLREKPYQVLSADYMMPGMTGAEFLAQARVLQPETVRILLTAAHDFSAAVDAINNGESWSSSARNAPTTSRYSCEDGSRSCATWSTASRITVALPRRDRSSRTLR